MTKTRQALHVCPPLTTRTIAEVRRRHPHLDNSRRPLPLVGLALDDAWAWNA